MVRAHGKNGRRKTSENNRMKNTTTQNEKGETEETMVKSSDGEYREEEYRGLNN